MDELTNHQLQDPETVAEYIQDACQHFGFPLRTEENDLCEKVARRAMWGEKTACQDLHELRCLYWQAVGFMRGACPNKDE
jgi:hypothetical protein